MSHFGSDLQQDSDSQMVETYGGLDSNHPLLGIQNLTQGPDHGPQSIVLGQTHSPVTVTRIGTTYRTRKNYDVTVWRCDQKLPPTPKLEKRQRHNRRAKIPNKSSYINVVLNDAAIKMGTGHPKLLYKGLSFIPTPTDNKQTQIRKELDRLSRSWNLYYWNQSFPTTGYQRKTKNGEQNKNHCDQFQNPMKISNRRGKMFVLFSL